eukprot:gnl/Trimastix_PCT/300.p1 GENE.gnl/Trimastix_PCT/300~~gnl/Trimastix_PCT/300.p1  ORF type:complete len:362 (+),score=56.10 gnl/Trimastix_PCT/300:34-1119(+)
MQNPDPNDPGLYPLILTGHQRPITCLQFNHDSDLLFTASKDGNVILWFADDGSYVRKYSHEGVVWSIDINRASTQLITGSGDCHAIIWDLERGDEIFNYTFESTVRVVKFAIGDKKVLIVLDPFRDTPGRILVFDIERFSTEPIAILENRSCARITGASWGFMNRTIITTHDDGMIGVWDPSESDDSKQLKKHVLGHEKAITSLTMARDYSCFLTASHDMSGKLWDAETLDALKIYPSDLPLNAGAIAPCSEHICLAGGHDTRSITTQRHDADQFKMRIYQTVYETFLGSLRGHFGPIHSIAFSPDGNRMVSGSEDGMVRMVHLSRGSFYHLAELSLPKRAEAATAATAPTTTTTTTSTST